MSEVIANLFLLEIFFDVFLFYNWQTHVRCFSRKRQFEIYLSFLFWVLFKDFFPNRTEKSLILAIMKAAELFKFTASRNENASSFFPRVNLYLLWFRISSFSFKMYDQGRKRTEWIVNHGNYETHPFLITSVLSLIYPKCWAQFSSSLVFQELM